MKCNVFINILHTLDWYFEIKVSNTKADWCQRFISVLIGIIIKWHMTFIQSN